MKKIIFLMMLAAAQTVGAQQLPNVGFESWKGSGNAGYTYQSSSASVSGTSNEGLRQRPGDEPIGWMGSSINQKVIMQKKQELIFNNQ